MISMLMGLIVTLRKTTLQIKIYEDELTNNYVDENGNFYGGI